MAVAALDLMKSRRSVRRFKPDLPGRGLIEKLIEAAVTAPSASNKQPWRFLVVTSRPAVSRMADAVREAVERVSKHVEAGWRDAFRDYGDYFTRFESAPVVIVPLYRGLELLSNMTGPSLPQADRRRIVALEAGSGLVSVSLAIQNLLLMAHSLGLGASAMTGPLIALDKVRAILEVPGSWDVAAVIPVGFPAEEPPPISRKSAEQVTRWIE
ncbi:MAG: nitroreductase family protein [Elusimicrobia bacterium]|nr:nitroreductase family protein [Elusimicrobiota bacterium]